MVKDFGFCSKFYENPLKDFIKRLYILSFTLTTA